MGIFTFPLVIKPVDVQKQFLTKTRKVSEPKIHNKLVGNFVGKFVFFSFATEEDLMYLLSFLKTFCVLGCSGTSLLNYTSSSLAVHHKY